MRVYWKNVTGKLSRMDVPEEVTDHEEAILLVKEHLVGTGEGYNGAVLAVFEGGLSRAD